MFLEIFEVFRNPCLLAWTVVQRHCTAAQGHWTRMQKRPCEKIDCDHIAYSKSGFYYHQKHCKIEMSYQEHAGYTHMRKLVDKGSKKYAVIYYQTLEFAEREHLRGCLALFHKELQKRKKSYDELKKDADTLEEQMAAINFAKELSEDPEVESPPKKAKEDESARQPTAVNWSFLGMGGGSSSSASTASGPAKV